MLPTTNDHHTTLLAVTGLSVEYDAERCRLDAAYRRMREITAVPHPSAQARAAADELTTALRRATELATRALQSATNTSPVARRHRLIRRKADRSVPTAVRPWSAELVRLAEIGVWLRRTTLDDPGVHLPKTVRVANYAAKGPHIAGLDFGNQAADRPGGPRIGIDFAASIDRTNSAEA